MKRELTIEIPLLLAADGDKFLIKSDHLGIYIQGSSEEKAIKMFTTAMELLFSTWEKESRLIGQLRAGGLLKKDVLIKEYRKLDEKSIRSLVMPDLQLGHYDNAHLAVS